MSRFEELLDAYGHAAAGARSYAEVDAARAAVLAEYRRLEDIVRAARAVLAAAEEKPR